MSSVPARRDLHAAWLAAMWRGDDAAAWAVNDVALQARDRASRDDPTLPYHQRWVWNGDPVAGRDVLVRCYHGLGDTLQFVRFLPALRARARSVTLEAQASLVDILCTSGFGPVLPFVADAPAKAADLDIEIMELSHALRLPPACRAPPYIVAPARRSEPGAIGLCWQAGPWDAERSIPASLLAPLSAWPCVALQPHAGDVAVVNPGGCGSDISQTAALIAGLDLVITVDSMVAHLAGALGRPTWLLLKHAPDWRWGPEGRASRWYPSMRLFRQAEPGDWAGVMREVSKEARSFSKKEPKTFYT